MNNYSVDRALSKHARRRASQRGIRYAHIRLMRELADCEVPAGAGCSKLTLSTAGHSALVSEGFPPKEADRLKRLTLILSNSDKIITCYRHRS